MRNALAFLILLNFYLYSSNSIEPENIAIPDIINASVVLDNLQGSKVSRSVTERHGFKSKL